MALYFVEISGSSTRLTSVAFQGIKDALQGLRGQDDSQIYHCYRTVGENKLMLVIKGDADLVVDSIYVAVDADISVTCTPLRPFETFMRNQGADEKICADISPHFASPKCIFYAKASLNHPGKSTEEFHNIWKEHSEGVMALRASGVRDFRIYKVVGRREVIIFFNAESADKLDDDIPKSKIVQNLGDGVELKLKALQSVM